MLYLTRSRFCFIIENGEYLGLDLGGTNFRVVRVVMKDGEATTTTKYYNLDDKILSGPCQHVSHLCYSSTFTVQESSVFTGGSMSMALMGKPLTSNLHPHKCIYRYKHLFNIYSNYPELATNELHHYKPGILSFGNPLTLTPTNKNDYDSSVNLCIM